MASTVSIPVAHSPADIAADLLTAEHFKVRPLLRELAAALLTNTIIPALGQADHATWKRGFPMDNSSLLSGPSSGFSSLLPTRVVSVTPPRATWWSAGRGDTSELIQYPPPTRQLYLTIGFSKEAEAALTKATGQTRPAVFELFWDLEAHLHVLIKERFAGTKFSWFVTPGLSFWETRVARHTRRARLEATDDDNDYGVDARTTRRHAEEDKAEAATPELSVTFYLLV